MNLFEYNLNYAQAGVTELKDYLLSKELFWPLSLQRSTGEAPYPKLTIGNLLFFLQRAKASAQGAAQNTQLTRVEDEIYTISITWRTAWEDKAEREFISRLRQWQNFINEMGKESNSSSSYYSSEVKLRVLLDLLLETLPDRTEKDFSGLDTFLKTRFEPGEFLWEQEYSSAFLADKYWYLYGKLK